LAKNKIYEITFTNSGNCGSLYFDATSIDKARDKFEKTFSQHFDSMDNIEIIQVPYKKPPIRGYIHCVFSMN